MRTSRAHQLQLDLFGAVLTDDEYRGRLAAFRASLQLDCCTGQPLAGGEVRCGRCGELTSPYGMVINHDTGWTGCIGHRREYANADQLSAGRHDSRHHAACAGCGHAWGIHVGHSLGVKLPEESFCYGWCGCKGYRDPAASA
jgi:hypothetical protein